MNARGMGHLHIPRRDDMLQLRCFAFQAYTEPGRSCAYSTDFDCFLEAFLQQIQFADQRQQEQSLYDQPEPSAQPFRAHTVARTAGRRQLDLCGPGLKSVRTPGRRRHRTSASIATVRRAPRLCQRRKMSRPLIVLNNASRWHLS